MHRYLFLALATLIVAACASSPHGGSERALSLEVAGFVQAEGIT